MPGAAKDTIVKALTSPLLGTVTFAKSVCPQLAQALRRSKNLALQLVHSLATKCGSGSSTR